MAERVQKTKSTGKQEAAPQVEDVKTDEKQALKDELDALLDEVDSVLEENAEEFVKSYVQKGGQLAQTAWENIKRGFLSAFPRNPGFIN